MEAILLSETEVGEEAGRRKENGKEHFLHRSMSQRRILVRLRSSEGGRGSSSQERTLREPASTPLVGNDPVLDGRCLKEASNVSKENNMALASSRVRERRRGRGPRKRSRLGTNESFALKRQLLMQKYTPDGGRLGH